MSQKNGERSGTAQERLFELWGEVVDLGSANGTVVNGDRVREHELTHGDRIQIGKTVLAFKED